MAGFKYAFQKVVDLKSSEKTQVEWELSAALGILTAEQGALSILLETLHEWEWKLQQTAEQATALSELQAIQHYIEFLKDSIEQKRADVRKADHEVDKAREKLSYHVKDEKVWLKAKEHARNRFNHEMQLKEQQEMDDLTTARFLFS